MSVFPGKVLCKSYPSEFVTYFHYCRSLRFEDKPDYSYLKRLFRDLFIREGYQLDYEFNWTMLKYPQIRDNKLRPNGKTSGLVGPSAERTERTAGEVYARRIGSGSGHNGELTKHRTLLDSLMSSKAIKPGTAARQEGLSFHRANPVVEIPVTQIA
ncbi:hypothetical protein GUJ93_ZPchr0004g40379 [Zizania palustris]|uniref:Non-specific serine/threonine protein kinase n=1 Tax=Zizania palustris TaxID=103762 RepID=A0A8J5SJP7_ZIZPA|nr:hypothetical protein GUJ93_ZPchr0004g40379 [Zizania palustris]